MNSNTDFVPALGRHELTGQYDKVIALMTRERRWRQALLTLAAPGAGETILDVGCGTGTFAIMLKREAPAARVIGLDPDPAVLEIAKAKAQAAGVAVDWRQGPGDALTAAAEPASLDKVVSSLVLHQCPLPVKRSILASAREVLRPGGVLLIADYGWQRTGLMRLLFRQVQALDGFDKTQPNADGVLPQLMREAGFVEVQEVTVTPTPTGSISIYRAQRPA